MSILSTEFSLDAAKGVWYEEGIEEGIEKGIEKKALKIARTMLIDGEPVEKIIRYTDLSRGDVENLRTTI